MTTATRSRAFPNFTMPPGPNDNPQQPVGSNGFPGSHLYPNKNIWTSSLSNARERSMGAKDADESPSGSSALNVNSEADVWGSNPWNTNDNPPRSVSTSPNRARDVPLSTGSAFFDHPPAAIGMKKSAFGDMYQTHTPSNSIQSQRPLSNQHSGFPPQSANQRAFNYNNKIDDDVAYQFNRRAVLDGNPTGPNSTLPFNPASQPFQFNPGSQPWMGDGGATRLGNGVDFGTDSLTSQFAAMKRPSVDRISPAPGYRLDNSTSPRTYAQSPDMWMNRPSSRDPRAEIERRGSAQYPQSFTPSYYGGGYPYGGLTSQFAPNFMDQYGHGFRHQMVPGYGLPSVSSGYPIGSNMSSPRPSRDQDPGKGMRSALLDEFRLSNKSSKRYELKDIYNYVVEFSGDQHGSRFIQQKLETANSDEKEQVFREIEPNAVQLMKDVFGNYVVQKFFEHGNQVQKKVLAEKMRGKVVDLSVQVYACRVVQKALEHVLVEQQAELTKELEPEIIRVIRDQNGNHVVQKIVELVPREYIDFIMNALRGQVTALASHTYGCRVIQRMLEYGTEADKLDIMNELHSSAQILITDQYGNYVAQHVIQNGKPKDRETLIQLVMAQLLTLSKHKFASNVVEKCIEHGTAEQRTRIREQLTMVGSDGTSPLQQMMRDQYGNYVIQKLLGQLQGSERDALVEDIKPQFFVLKKNGASRQLQALEKLLGVGNGAAGLTRNETPTSGDINSTSPTPVLTNETNSPQSSSPPSTYVSAVGMPTTEETKKTTANGVNSAGPQVQVEDA